MLSLPKLPQVWSSYFVDQVFGPLSKGVRGVQALDICCCASTAELTLATHTPTLHKQFSMLFLFLVFYLQSLTLCDCSPAPSLYFFTSSLPTANKRIPLINVLAASLSVPVEPSRGQDPYSCNASEFCMVMWTGSSLLAPYSAFTTISSYLLYFHLSISLSI